MKQVDLPKFFIEPDPSTWTRDIWNGSLARLVDTISTSKFHLSPDALMETAGRSVAKIAIERGAESHPVIIICGQGNNGADGLVAARTLFDHGATLTVVIITDTEKKPSDQFSKQLATIEAMHVPTTTWRPGTLKSLSYVKPIIIDAVSGLGFKPPCSGGMLKALTEASQIEGSTVIAVDIPSGISPDDGNLNHAPLPATETVTFGSTKPIHRLMPSASFCGHVTVSDIGFPVGAIKEALTAEPPIWREVNPHEILARNPWESLPSSSHKYDRGHILIIGGSTGKIGAPILAAMAGLKTGAGWCSLAIPRNQIQVDTPVPSELTIENFFDGSTINIDELTNFLKSRRVATIVIGPGWTRQCLDLKTVRCLREFCNAGGNIVLDAGALHGIASLILADGPLPKGRGILTPHHGEWQKLQDLSAPPPLTPDGVAAASQYATKLGAHIIYKNAAPVILSPFRSDPIVCITGTKSLARAGSGDILTGIIAAHLAIGCTQDFSAARAYTLLARSAMIAAQEVGDDAVLASDILARLGIASRL